MKTYQSVDEINLLFKQRQLDDFPNTFVINEVQYLEYDTLFPERISEMFNKSKKIISVFSPRARSAEQRIVFVWGIGPGLVIAPLFVKAIGRYRTGNEESIMKESETVKEEPTIGKHIEIILLSFNNEQPIIGKVDTGATICSLHAENIKINKDPLNPDSQIVSFEFNENRYSMNLEQQQAVQSADGGINYRPVVKFNVKFDGKVFSDVLFNLNDRSDMEDKLLVGLNLLEKIGYKIDPKKEGEEPTDSVEVLSEDEINYIIQEVEKEMEKQTNEIKVEQQPTNNNIHAVYEFLLKQDVTFADLLKHVKTETIRIVEQLEP